MGSSNFEAGEQAARLRELNENAQVGEVMVWGRMVKVLYNPDFFNLEGVERVLNELFRGEHMTEEPIQFDQDSYKKGLAIRRGELPAVADPVNAWFDVEHGLFWTYASINIADVRKNIRKSVEHMSQVRQNRRLGPSLALAPNDPHRLIRERMIAEGRLRPRR